MPGLAMRPRPVESRRQRHTITAVVVGHVDHTLGMWWWKQIIPSLKVRFEDAGHQQLLDLAESISGYYIPVPQTVEVGYETMAKRDAFVIGEAVMVKFSTSNQVDAFFTGAQLFRWDGLEKLSQ